MNKEFKEDLDMDKKEKEEFKHGLRKLFCEKCKNILPEGLKKSDITYIYTTGPSTNYERKDLDMDKKEEFKVDKLGWYECKDGKKWKIIHKYEKGHHFIAVNKENTCNFTVHKSGREDYETYFELVKYLGPELPKEPRKFEFEGWIGEFFNNKNVDNFSVDNNIGHSCTNFLNNKKLSGIYDDYNFDRISKWHVTMTEIIE